MMLHYLNTFARFLLGSVHRLAGFVIAVLLGLSLNAHAATFFVKPVASGNGSGSSWTNASSDLQDIIDDADQLVGNDEIWVSAGTYVPTVKYPSGTDNRNKTFLIKQNGLKIYGGFAGTETELAQRNPAVNVTILSGEIQTSALTDNCYHVVTFDPGPVTCIPDTSCSPDCGCEGLCPSYPAAITASVQLDGFQVTRGCANNTASTRSTQGGGLYYTLASPVVQNCTILNNHASSSGGGAYVAYSAFFTPCAPTYDVLTPQFISTAFLGNVTENGGGGIAHEAAEPTFTNCVFSGNLAWDYGGGIAGDDGKMFIKDCTFSLNKAEHPDEFDTAGGAISNGPTLDTEHEVIIVNSILWGNTATTNPQIDDHFSGDLFVTYSDIEGGGFSGTGNINSNPLFVNDNGDDDIPGTIDDNVRLGCTSPARNTGSNAAVPQDAYDVDDDQVTIGAGGEKTPDRDRTSRIADSIVDMGAYEKTTQTTSCLGEADGFIHPTQGVNVDDLLAIINAWGDCPNPPAACLADIAPPGCHDGLVNVDDLLQVINNWGRICATGLNGGGGGSITTVQDCMDACSLEYTPFSTDWDECVNKCVGALCEAEILDCD